MAKAKLGSGARFKTLKDKLSVDGSKNPAGLAAYIGRKKYGKKKFQKLAAEGKQDAHPADNKMKKATNFAG